MDPWHLEHQLAQALEVGAAEDPLRRQRLTLEMEYVRADRPGVANYEVHRTHPQGRLSRLWT